MLETVQYRTSQALLRLTLVL